MRIVLKAALLCVVSLVPCACAKHQTQGGSSETHFLSLCSSGGCGEGLQCICGTCSKPCSSDGACGALADGAVCAGQSGATCFETEICDVECTANADCEALGGDYSCKQGRCRGPEVKSTSTGAPSGPSASSADLVYGPCTDNPMCGNGNGVVRQSSDGTCLCSVFCNEDDECPQPETGTVEATCVTGDVVRNGFAGSCELSCANGETCPNDSTCHDGECRWGELMSSGDEPTGASQLAGCSPDDVVAIISMREPLLECGELSTEPSSTDQAAAVGCVRTALANDQPFHVSWRTQGKDSIGTQGFAVRDTADGPEVFSLSHDPFGIEPDGALAHWTRCADFEVLDDCSEIASCFECKTKSSPQCSCSLDPATGAPVQGCGDPPDQTTTPPAGPCRPDACDFDGVCYPLGETTEDGCCTCDVNGGACIEPGWCPGWVHIGQRCASNEDCDAPRSGLRCETRFFGERGVCTRDCNFGCPDTTQCVAGVPDYNGGTLHDVCLRPCTSAAECDTDPAGRQLDSECDTTDGLVASFCF